jgi:HSP20 family protein
MIRYQLPTLSTWSRFDRLANLRDEVTRLFDFSVPDLAGQTTQEGTTLWRPALDVFQDKDNIFVTLEVPGVKKEDFQLSLHEGTLTVSGERKQTTEVKEGESFRSERFFGRFSRSVTLQVPVQADNVKAQYKDGVLTVTLAKSEEAKPRQIEVQVS